MDTLTIVFSVISLAFSVFALGWNFYRDVILKPRLQVLIGVQAIVGQHGVEGTFITLSAVNFGPGVIHLNGIYLKESSVWKRLRRKVKHGFIRDMVRENPSVWTLPCKLEVADKATFLLRLELSRFLTEAWNYVGLGDTFGRVHWASKCSLAHARKEYPAALARNRGAN